MAKATKADSCVRGTELRDRISQLEDNTLGNGWRRLLYACHVEIANLNKCLDDLRGEWASLADCINIFARECGTAQCDALDADLRPFLSAVVYKLREREQAAITSRDELESLRMKCDEYQRDSEALDALRRHEVDALHFDTRWEAYQYGEDYQTKRERSADPADAVIEYVTRHYNKAAETPAEHRRELCDLFRRLAWRAVVDWDGVRTDELVQAIYDATGEKNPRGAA